MRWRRRLKNGQPGAQGRLRWRNDRRPKAGRPAPRPVADPDILSLAESWDTWLHGSRRQCRRVSWRQNPAASCRNATYSRHCERLGRRLEPEEIKTRRGLSSSSYNPQKPQVEISSSRIVFARGAFHSRANNPVATGLWPVMQIGSLRERNGPQGCGYNVAISFTPTASQRADSRLG